MDIRKKLYYTTGQIRNGLYTKGKEWMFLDGIEYIGDYHMYTTTNEVFTKSQWIKGVSKKLVPYLDLSQSDVNKTFEYDNLKKVDIPIITETLYNKPTPVERDYINGFFTRYFVKRYFQSIITEVNKDSYSNTTQEFYVKVELLWKLTGPLNDTDVEMGVYDTNRRLVLLAEKDMVGIRNYVTNYTEYARLSQ
jgi:hypothetical protein